MALLPPLPAKYKGRILAGMALCVGLGAWTIWGEHGLLHLRRLQQEQTTLEQLAFDLSQNNEHMRQKLWRLKHDDRYLEKVARERLGLVKKGEIIYRLDAPKPEPGQR